jgi:hypothetical protein
MLSLGNRDHDLDRSNMHQPFIVGIVVEIQMSSMNRKTYILAQHRRTL